MSALNAATQLANTLKSIQGFSINGLTGDQFVASLEVEYDKKLFARVSVDATQPGTNSTGQPNVAQNPKHMKIDAVAQALSSDPRMVDLPSRELGFFYWALIGTGASWVLRSRQSSSGPATADVLTYRTDLRRLV